MLRLPEDDRRKNNTVIAGLDPAIHKHKALAHDMHIESNAFQQMFAPLPVSRSSWPQLVISVFFSSPLSFPCLARESVKEIFGSSPNMTGKRPRITVENGKEEK